jgi:hypothetical protein
MQAKPPRSSAVVRRETFVRLFWPGPGKISATGAALENTISNSIVHVRSQDHNQVRQPKIEPSQSFCLVTIKLYRWSSFVVKQILHIGFIPNSGNYSDSWLFCRGGRIRTHGPREGTTVFKASYQTFAADRLGKAFQAEFLAGVSSGITCFEETRASTACFRWLGARLGVTLGHLNGMPQ